jgi:hypothetical protein
MERYIRQKSRPVFELRGIVGQKVVRFILFSMRASTPEIKENYSIGLILLAQQV